MRTHACCYNFKKDNIGYYKMFSMEIRAKKIRTLRLILLHLSIYQGLVKFYFCYRKFKIPSPQWKTNIVVLY